MSSDHYHWRGLESYPIQLERQENTERDESSGYLEEIPLKPGRELVKVARRNSRCYRLEKTRCGKKSCRCARGELHGPYWYAYYRENGRVRCEYVGKSLPEHVSLENRSRKACKSAEAERRRAAEIIAKLKATLNKTRRSGDPVTA